MLALVIAEDGDLPTLGHPVAQVVEEEVAALVLHDEIAARRMQKIMGEKTERIAGSGAGFVPGIFLRPEMHGHNLRGKIVAQRRFTVRGRLQSRTGEADFGAVERLHGALGVDIDFAQRDELVILPFGAQRASAVP